MHAFFENRADRFETHTSRGLSYPLHLHPHLELFFMLSGKTTVTVREKSQILTPGSLAVIFPNQIHSYTAHSAESRATLVICELARTGGYVDLLLRSHPKNPFLKPELLHPNVAFAIGQMTTEQGSGGNSSVYAPLVQLVLARVLPLLNLSRNKSADYRELTYQIADYVGGHFRDPLTLTELARKLGVSKFHLSHVFSEKFGQSFSSYLTKIRLACACGMLTDTAGSITEIAEESGFESQRTFFRVFRQQYEETPLQYRRRVQGGSGPDQKKESALPAVQNGFIINV